MTVIRLRRRQNPAYRFSRFYQHMEESYRLSQRLKLLQYISGIAMIAAALFLVWRVHAAFNLPLLPDGVGIVTETCRQIRQL